MESSHRNTRDDGLRAVKPVRPLAAYIGGKRMLAKRLCALIAATPHKAYAEAFVGMGGIFFRRDRQPSAEIINDWSTEVHNLFRIIQVHYVPFVDMMRHQLTFRSEFDRLIAVNPDTLTDMQRAARFLYLQRTAFGGKVEERHFGVSPLTGARFNVANVVPMLEAVHERLCRVTIERMPWADFIRRYDREGMLFYLDPPYFGCENDYGRGMFERSEFDEMAELLGTIKGRFILSINDKPEIRELFGRFDMLEQDVRYTISGNANAGKFGELIITGG